MKKAKTDKKRITSSVIDWKNDPRFKELMAPLVAKWERKEYRQKDLSRFSETLNGDPIENAYNFIEYFYNNYNETYGDYEFLVLLASRGFDVSTYKMSIFKDWKSASQKEKEYRSISSYYDAETGETKTSRINIDDFWPYPQFWKGDRSEFNTIDATILRTVDHFKISGFDEYWQQLNEDLTLSVADTSEGQYLMSQYLFNMCRSDLSARLLYNRMTIITQLMIHGKDPKVKYFWEYRSWDREGPHSYNCPYIAAGLMFSILKMGLLERYSDVISACETFLASAQTSNGGWKAVSFHDTESIDATAVCIHALALHNREKYKDVLTLAAEYLISKQDSWWLWHEDENPYVSYPYLSVLVLDALELVKGNDDKLTFTKKPLQTSESQKNDLNSYIINVNMGDTNNFKGGQFGAVGSHAKAEHNTFNQANYNLPENLDYNKLVSELGALKTTMKDRAGTPAEFQALAEVASAQQAASDKDGSKVVQKLMYAGKWAVDTAKEIGVGVVVELINKQITG